MSLRDFVRDALEVVRDVAGEDVVYTDGLHSVSLKAIPGNASNTVSTVQALSVVADEHDWLIQVADLVLNGAPAIPRKGAQIAIERDGRTLTYQVTPKGTEQPYRLDPTGSLYRIRTKLVNRE